MHHQTKAIFKFRAEYSHQGKEAKSGILFSLLPVATTNVKVPETSRQTVLVSRTIA